MGLVALSARNMPVVIVDGDLASAPGVTMVQLKQDGVLIVGTLGIADTVAKLAPLGVPTKNGEMIFSIAGARRGQSVRLTWAIIPPAR